MDIVEKKSKGSMHGWARKPYPDADDIQVDIVKRKEMGDFVFGFCEVQ